MSRNRRSWIFGILFWVLFLISIWLNDRYRWLDAAWFIGMVLLGTVASILIVVEMARNRDGSGEYLYYKGVPRFVRWALINDEQFAKDLQKRKLWDAKRKSKRLSKSCAPEKSLISDLNNRWPSGKHLPHHLTVVGLFLFSPKSCETQSQSGLVVLCHLFSSPFNSM
jgi:hypothetical protein